MSHARTEGPRLTDHEHALMHAVSEVVEQCENVIAAHKRRAPLAHLMTLNEAQEIAILRIRLDDLAEVQATGSAEPS